jgi:hypothetical protein
LQNQLDRIPGREMLILDAFRSGEVGAERRRGGADWPTSSRAT